MFALWLLERQILLIIPYRKPKCQSRFDNTEYRETDNIGYTRDQETGLRQTRQKTQHRQYDKLICSKEKRQKDKQ
jgi:hypothetical protein